MIEMNRYFLLTQLFENRNTQHFFCSLKSYNPSLIFLFWKSNKREHLDLEIYENEKENLHHPKIYAI